MGRFKIGKHGNIIGENRNKFMLFMIIQQQYIGVYGVLISSQGLLLVQKRRGPYLGWWDLPGGGLRHGEDIKTALRRELEEETHLSVTEKDLCFWKNMTALTEQKDLSFFHIGMLYKITAFDPLQIRCDINKEDVAGAEWHLKPTEPLTPFAAEAMRYLTGGRQAFS